MAAYRNGIKTVIIPKANEPDLYEVDPVVKENVTFVPVKEISAVLEKALVPVLPLCTPDKTPPVKEEAVSVVNKVSAPKPRLNA